VSPAVVEEIVIAVAPERLWDAVMDPTVLERWVSAHESVAGAEPGPVGEGDDFEQRLRLAGKSFAVRWRVVEVEAPRFARWIGDGPAGSSARVAYELEPLDGATRFRYESEFALPGGLLGRVAGAALAVAPARREARRSLERLRALLEG
jgi:uncharacterized protein YndB with AHSA1/START domain